MTRRRLCVFTGTRADFGLLRPLLLGIMQDAALELQLIVTGSHLAAEFGMSCHEIEAAGIPIARKIEILLASDTPVGVCKAAGLGMIGFGEALDELKPDIAVVLGDRFEALAAAFSALIMRIPVAHLHGGEASEGAIDDSLRHAITKIASLHFVAAAPYRDRVVQMGERPDRVFMVGGLGVDAMLSVPLLDREVLERQLGFSFDGRTLLATIHPATASDARPELECEEMLAALQSQPDIRVIFTLANADAGGRAINERIKSFAAQYPDRALCVASLGSQLYFSCLRQVAGVIGNSSSGLLEAPSFHVGTVNIGDRQKGRLRSASVLDCNADRRSIGAAIERLFSADFQRTVASAVNPYGTGGASAKILTVLKSARLDALRSKPFYDMPSQPADH